MTSVQQDKATIDDVYRRIAQTYDQRIPGFTELDDAFSATEISYVLDRLDPADTVLDIGCGTGRLTLPVARKVTRTVGFDMSQEMLDQAGAKTREEELPVTFEQGDMTNMPFPDDSFDAVVSILALMHVPREQRLDVFSEIRRVLRPGGTLVIGVKNAVFERFSRADRFATVDITDVDNGELVFTQTEDGEDLRAPWHSFSPDELRRLSVKAGLAPVDLRGNLPMSAWLSDTVLADSSVRDAVAGLEKVLGDLPPFNHLGYHLLFEAVRPGGERTA